MVNIDEIAIRYAVNSFIITLKLPNKTLLTEVKSNPGLVTHPLTGPCVLLPHLHLCGNAIILKDYLCM